MVPMYVLINEFSHWISLKFLVVFISIFILLYPLSLYSFITPPPPPPIYHKHSHSVLSYLSPSFSPSLSVCLFLSLYLSLSHTHTISLSHTHKHTHSLSYSLSMLAWTGWYGNYNVFDSACISALSFCRLQMAHKGNEHQFAFRTGLQSRGWWMIFVMQYYWVFWCVIWCDVK